MKDDKQIPKLTNEELLAALQKEVNKYVVSYVLIDLFKELDKRYRYILEEIETIKNQQ